MWRITGNEVSGGRHFFINLAKTIYLSIQRFVADDLVAQAGALTFNTLLAIVPALALVFAVAKGFGFQAIVQSQLFDYFPAQREALEQAMIFVDSYLAQTKNGIFVGVGILFLIWSIVALLNSVETTFNNIWQVSERRSIYRKVVDYIAIMVLIPLLMIVSAGLSIFVTSGINASAISFLNPLLRFALAVSPYVLTCIVFFAIYMLIPNTRVKFWNAMISGIVCGLAFQLLQIIYIGGQVWISRYNAIYGSFAFLLLLLLWMWISWLICLFGAVLTYSSQNVEKFNFDKEIKTISRRYRDFVVLIVVSVIVQRFVRGDTPPTHHQIASGYHIPVRLVGSILQQLVDAKIIRTTPTDDELVWAYVPAIDAAQLSVGTVMRRLDRNGSEKFKIDRRIYRGQWHAMLDVREASYLEGDKTLVKDLTFDFPDSDAKEEEC
ncbi:MAG: YihY/virulence factor BrkB family protein [Porphyromonadaceae bacterium]|nr:YihY/virulence factor BrkB family protein [Porphyromonadaceae bacterium]